MDEFGEADGFKRFTSSRPDEPPAGRFEPAPSVQHLLCGFRPGAFEALVQFVVDLLNVPTAYITLVDEHRFYLLAGRGMERRVYRRDHLPDNALLRKGTPHLVSTPGSDSGGEEHRWRGEDGWMMWMGAAALVPRDRVVGTVGVASVDRSDWSWNDLRCLTRVAEDVLQKLRSPGQTTGPG